MSIKQLSKLQTERWYEVGLQLGLTENEMGHIRNSRYPTTEMFLAAKRKNVELRWSHIWQALLSVDERDLADSIQGL